MPADCRTCAINERRLSYNRFTRVVIDMEQSKPYSLSVEDSIVFVKLTGLMDNDTTDTLCADMRATAERHIDFRKPWAVIIDCRQWGFSVPYSESCLLELEAWCRERGQHFQVMILDKQVFRRNRINKLTGSAVPGIVYEYFTDPEAARNWLRRRGF